jgi:hypothetical protein
MVSYGTWREQDPDRAATVEESVVALLGDYVLGSNIPAIAAAYRAAVNNALPNGVVLAWNEFLGAPGVTFDLRAAVARVDFWAIAKRYGIEP